MNEDDFRDVCDELSFSNDQIISLCESDDEKGTIKYFLNTMERSWFSFLGTYVVDFSFSFLKKYYKHFIKNMKAFE